MIRLLACAASAALLLVPAAHADQAEPRAHLACKGDEFAVRFDLGFAIEPMDKAHADKWRDVPLSADGRCILSTGQKVILKWIVYPAYAWGAGGAAPPASFSLWIDGKAVRFGSFKSGYGERAFHLNNLFYAPGRLTVCKYDTATNVWEPRGNVACAEESLDLNAMPVDWNAPDYDDPRTGEITFITSHSAPFCRRFIHPQSDNSGLRVFVNRGSDTRQMIAIDEQQVSFPEFAEAPALSWYGDHPEIGHIDVFGAGKPQTVISFFGEYKQFDGNFYMSRDGEATPADLEAFSKLKENEQYSSYFAAKAEKLGWKHLGGELDPFTHHSLFRLDGKFYVMAVKRPAYTDSNPEPTAVLYEPIAVGTARYLATVCTFQMTAHF